MSDSHNTNDQGIDVQYVAKLARLKLSDEEAAVFQEQLENIVHYVQKVSELDVSDVEPTAHGIPVHNVLREDRVKPSLDRDKVLKNAPNEQDDQFIVPKIVE